MVHSWLAWPSRIATTALLIGAPALMLVKPAEACRTRPLDAKTISFASDIRSSDEIVLARVSAARELTPDEREKYLDQSVLAPFEFTLKTVEVLKGATAAEFTVGGKPDIRFDPAKATSEHDTIGAFWTVHTPTCGIFSHAFALGQEYLIIRSADGKIRLRGAQPIPRRDDKWLAAVRTVLAHPERRFGRTVAITEFLRTFDLIMRIKRTGCGSDGRAVLESGIVWGAAASIEGWSTEGLFAGTSHDCNPEERLVMIQTEAMILRLPAPGHRIDFNILIRDRSQGLYPPAEVTGEVFAAEIDVTGQMDWDVDDLQRGLNGAD